MKLFNEKLQDWQDNEPSPNAGINNIQIPGQPENIVWQHRSSEPSLYESSLAQNIITAFTHGAQTIDELVAALNEQGALLESGQSFTIENFENEMARLGY